MSQYTQVNVERFYPAAHMIVTHLENPEFACHDIMINEDGAIYTGAYRGHGVLSNF